MAPKHIAFTLVVVMCCVLMHSASALIHVVGGSDGWEVPPNATFYADWAKPRVFGQHDKLVFPYRVGGHNVLEVSAEDFKDCGHDHVIEQYYKGPTVIELNKTGDYYFYSGIGTHCELGQKLHINVVQGPGFSGHRFGHHHRRTLTPAPSPTSSASANAAHFLGMVSCSLLAMFFM